MWEFCVNLLHHKNFIEMIAQGKWNRIVPLIIFFINCKNISDLFNLHIIILIEIRVFFKILQCNVHLFLWNHYSLKETLDLLKRRPYFTFAISGISLITTYLNYFFTDEDLTSCRCCDISELLLVGKVPFKVLFINFDLDLGLGCRLK